MSRIVCRLSNAVPSGGWLSARFDRHRRGCLRCQADAANLLSVARDVGGLDGEMLEAPGGLHTRVMATLPVQDSSDPRRPLVVALVTRHVTALGVAVATLAAILGWRSHRRT
jgi:hypothetical protein